MAGNGDKQALKNENPRHVLDKRGFSMSTVGFNR
jgi:hypothetical protein